MCRCTRLQTRACVDPTTLPRTHPAGQRWPAGPPGTLRATLVRGAAAGAPTPPAARRVEAHRIVGGCCWYALAQVLGRRASCPPLPAAPALGAAETGGRACKTPPAEQLCPPSCHSRRAPAQAWSAWGVAGCALRVAHAAMLARTHQAARRCVLTPRRARATPRRVHAPLHRLPRGLHHLLAAGQHHNLLALHTAGTRARVCECARAPSGAPAAGARGAAPPTRGPHLVVHVNGVPPRDQLQPSRAYL